MNKIAYIFPGQGAQYVGMGKDLYDNSAEAKKVFDEAEKILPDVGIKKLCFEGPIEELTKTSNSQVCILVVSIAALRALYTFQATGSRFQVAGGLSLGELSSLVAVGSLKFSDAVKLVRRRGQLMEEASIKNPGSMASIIGISKQDLQQVCEAANADIANFNCHGQIVISGRKDAVELCMELAVKKGAKKAILLNVSGPFHSLLMKGAADVFKAELDKAQFSVPEIEIVSNVTADYEKTPEEIKENLFKQLFSPVRFEDSIRRIAGSGVSTFLEIGPGKVLKGLLRRIDPDLKVYNIEKMEDMNYWLSVN